jgi:hypothetical protein
MAKRWKHRHKILATGKDYLRHSESMSRMDRIKNETMRTKVGTKRHITRKK